MKQDFRTGNLDVLTAGELSSALHHHRESWFSQFERAILRGVGLKRIPQLTFTATATSFTLSGETVNNQACGPESGFSWRVASLLFESSNTGFTSAVLQNVVVGASGVATANLNPVPVQVVVSGGTVTAITINGVSTGATSGTFLLKPGDLIATTNTGAPTYTTTLPTGTSLPSTFNDNATGILYIGSDPTQTTTAKEVERKGLILGQRYNPPSTGLWVWPSEQFYIGITGATVGNQYSLTGIVAEVPTEMVGKLVAS